jgi:hypothetical protein
MNGLSGLQQAGRMRWLRSENGWVAHPDEIVAALADEGYQEVKREEAKTGRERTVAGGVWQGLNADTGSVAAAIWVNRPTADEMLVFIAIDGQPLTEGR